MAYEAASEDRYRIALAISSGCPSLCISVASAIVDQLSLGKASMRGVSIGPGQTEFTRMPRGVNSCAAVNARPRTAHLDALYADKPAAPKNNPETSALISDSIGMTYLQDRVAKT